MTISRFVAMLCLAILVMAGDTADAKEQVVMTVGGRKVGVDEFVRMYEKNKANGGDGMAPLDYAEMFVDYKLKVAEAEDLQLDTASSFVSELDGYRALLLDKYGESAEYDRLIKEYREGMLLYEINRRRLWDPAGKDIDALEEYFDAHRDRYSWGELHFKGYVVMAESDSLAAAAVVWLDENGGDADTEELTRMLRRQFGNHVRIEAVLAPKGLSKVVDHVGFGGEKPEPTGRWSGYEKWRGRIIDKPEEMNDVRSAVSNDLQYELEELWRKELRKRYKVKINRKVIEEAIKQ